jgi:hypothetical protein
MLSANFLWTAISWWITPPKATQVEAERKKRKQYSAEEKTSGEVKGLRREARALKDFPRILGPAKRGPESFSGFCVLGELSIASRKKWLQSL